METYHYEPLTTGEQLAKKSAWIYFFRQLLICSGGWTVLFINGLALGTPTVMIPQLKKDPMMKDQITESVSSWLTCTVLYAGALWTFVLAPLSNLLGRRITLGLASFTCFLGHIVFYFSTSLTHMFIGDVLQGVGNGSGMSVILYIMTEYPSSKNRGLFLTIKSASVMWGMWVSNSIGAFFYWKYISIAAFICFIYVTFLVIMPESPLWLAKQGRFDECVKAHRWLKGTDELSEKELKELIDKEKKNRQMNSTKISISKRLLILINIIKKKTFYKPLFVATLVWAQNLLSAKAVCTLYAVEIFRKITNDEYRAYILMIILDGVTVFGMYCGCVVARYVNRRFLLISTCILATIFLLLFTIYLYLIHIELFKEQTIISIVLLSLYSLAIACGPMISCYATFGEVMPVDHKLAFTIIGLLFHFAIAGTYIKLAPYIFNRLKMHIVFFIYSIIAFIGSVFMYYFLPETRDKTPAEIEDIFKDEKEIDVKDLACVK